VSNPLIRDAFEGMIVLGVGGTLFSAVRRLMRREISVNMCAACGRPCSRAYPNCTKCGTLQSR
jgi:hypothetical protein